MLDSPAGLFKNSMHRPLSRSWNQPVLGGAQAGIFKEAPGDSNELLGGGWYWTTPFSSSIAPVLIKFQDAPGDVFCVRLIFIFAPC